MDKNGDGKKKYTFNNDHGSQGQIHVQKVVACGWAGVVCGWAGAVLWLGRGSIWLGGAILWLGRGCNAEKLLPSIGGCRLEEKSREHWSIFTNFMSPVTANSFTCWIKSRAIE